jgi:hypothetical protein
MTLAVVWKVDGRLMAAADTRISRSAGNVLTEHGLKLLPISVVCRQCPLDGGAFDKEVYRADFGVAYSGATLTALAAHALSNTLLSNLNAPPGTPIPSLRDIADLFASVSARYMREVGQSSGLNSLFSGEIFRHVEPEDLLKYGLIPEFVGRLPVVATLEDLDETSLKKILTDPKNALVKQYQRLFEMENIELTFADEALGAVARKAIERKTGARGLRSILESILLETMFDLPGLEGVEEVVISREVVEGTARPLYIHADRSDRAVECSARAC